MEKCLLKKPTRISFRNAAASSDNNGNVSHRRRSGAQDEGTVTIEDIKLGE